MECYPLSTGIDKDSARTSRGLLKRKDSRGVVSAVERFMERSHIRSKSVITGVPTTQRLCRHLLRQGRTVLYFGQSEP